jgi:hypothetical protein
MDANTFDIIASFAIAVGTFALAGVTAYFSHNYRTRLRLDLASARLEAFGRLFETSGLAAPTRLAQAGERGVLTVEERDRLYHELTSWYYQNGNGMLLEGPTRDAYLKAKRNLTCDVSKIDPPSAWQALCTDFEHEPREDSEMLRGLLSMRQLSLLRSQLKAELAIFGNPFTGSLANHEAEFLKACGIDLDKPPWAHASARARRTEKIERLTSEDKPLALPEPSFRPPCTN